MKIGNFGSFDETLKKQGIVGLTNASRLDKVIWDEFNGRWDELAFESERLIALRLGKDIEAETRQVFQHGARSCRERTLAQLGILLEKPLRLCGAV